MSKTISTILSVRSRFHAHYTVGTIAFNQKLLASESGSSISILSGSAGRSQHKTCLFFHQRQIYAYVQYSLLRLFF